MPADSKILDRSMEQDGEKVRQEPQQGPQSS